jgi:outer membrane receptor for ferric coprogen and ferric-rhodotorulic acid
LQSIVCGVADDDQRISTTRRSPSSFCVQAVNFERLTMQRLIHRATDLCFIRTPLAAALASALAFHAPVRAEATLPAVEVKARQDAATLHLDEPGTTGSRTGVTARELPASIEGVDSTTIRERGDHTVMEAITRATGVTGVGAGGNGSMSFSTRGFSGTNSVGLAEDGVRLSTGAGTQTYPADSWGYERIEVLRGPASVVYGSGTVGATINAVRKARAVTPVPKPCLASAPMAPGVSAWAAAAHWAKAPASALTHTAIPPTANATSAMPAAAK